MTPAIAFAAALAAASPFANLDAIDSEVARFTGAKMGREGGAITPVDRRLRLRRCGVPLTLAWRTQDRRSVVVQCPDAGWRIYVPVRRSHFAVRAVPVIDRGDAVAIAVSSAGFTVSQPGEALEAGASGAWISVRPVGATRNRAEPLRARVVRPGLVELPLP